MVSRGVEALYQEYITIIILLCTLVYINHLELLVGSFAVQSFTKDQKSIHVHLRMDNSTARFYVSRMGEPALQV